MCDSTKKVFTSLDQLYIKRRKDDCAHFLRRVRYYGKSELATDCAERALDHCRAAAKRLQEFGIECEQATEILKDDVNPLYIGYAMEKIMLSAPKVQHPYGV